MQPIIHIVAGPTASGKSARALALARERGGVIINADATQLYADLRILSARPDENEMARAPHRLYGVLSADRHGSVGLWLELAAAEIRRVWREGALPILCGGTGLYLKALREGLSPIPDVPPEIRLRAEAEREALGNEELHRKLADVDSAFMQTLPAANTQRLQRAYEVWLATGKPMSYWQTLPKTPPFPDAQFSGEMLLPPREELYRRCDLRFERMMEHGAVEEVEALLARNLPETLPVMRAVGVPELAGYLRGVWTREEAVERAKRNTRRYAKRQLTWLRNQC